jgi:hypothetical protein
MKCEDVQALMARYLREELAPKARTRVAEHLSDCADCREELAFHRSLESRLDNAVQPPETLRTRVFERIESPSARPALLARLLGDPTMKKILISSTAVTAFVAMALLLTPRTANASTPAEKLNSMRAALARAAQSGELTLNLSSDNKGAVTVTGTLDGAPLPPDFPLHVDVTRTANYIDAHVTADLSPEDYKVLQFGRDENTLVMVPKASPSKKIEVGLDPKSMKPNSWTTWENLGGTTWKETSATKYKPKPAAKPKDGDDTKIDVKVRMYIGGTASISASGG